MPFQKYDGSSFVPSVSRQYDSSFNTPWWRGKPPRRWNGSRFVDAFLNDSLELHYDFSPDTVSAGSVRDLSGNDNDGTINNSVESYNTQSVGRELVMDGSDDEIIVPHDPSLDIQTEDFTIMVRLRIDSTSRDPIFNKKSRGGVSDTQIGYGFTFGKGGSISDYAGQPVYRYGDGSTTYELRTDALINSDGQHTFIITFDSATNTVTIDMDGVQIGQDSFATAPADNDAELVIGSHYTSSGSADEFLSGAIGELRLYSRILSADEKDALVEQARSRRETFRFTREAIPFSDSTNKNDPVSVYDPDKSNPYQLTLYDSGAGQTDLYETNTIDGSWTQVATDIGPGTGVTFQDAMIVDGTYHVIDSDDSVTNLWTGSDFQNLTNQGQILGEPDSGFFYDGSTWYLYPEEDPSGVGGFSMGVYTSSSADGTYTRQGTALDFNDRWGFKTGDPEIIEDPTQSGVYWMFFDVTTDHPNYGIGVARSEDLINWEFVEDVCTSHRGGDLRILDDGTNMWAYCEFADDVFQGRGIARFSVTQIT